MPLKKKSNGKLATWRPPHYGDNGRFGTLEDLQDMITQYFQNCPDTRTVISWWEEMQVPAPTLTWLALHLWFVNRASMYDYEWKPEFTNAIKRARTFMEREYEKQLLAGNATGAIFALKNFWRSDRQEITWAEWAALFSTITIKKHGASSDADG